MDVLRFILRRILIAIPVVIATSIITFIIAANTGDPLSQLALNPRTPRSVLVQKRIDLHLNDSILHRYEIWASHFIRGDFGKRVNGSSVHTALFDALGTSLRMILLAALLAVILGVTVGVISAVRQYTPLDYSATFASFLFYSIPVFWLAGLLKIIGIFINQHVHHTYFFTLGAATPDQTGSFFSHMGETLGHLYLPVLALTLVTYASWSRYQRASMLDVMGSDYVRLARAKGLSAQRVLVRHALRNALIPITTVVAIDFASLFSGAVGTEKVFGWQGMGSLLVDGVTHADTNVVLAWLMVTAVIVIAFNLLADLLYGVLDPRIR
ncbi:MAG: ABC transporter permease [Actinomycetota bacterium]|nr:ABC transporter permease [Actinomycetota bacterium]